MLRLALLAAAAGAALGAVPPQGQAVDFDPESYEEVRFGAVCPAFSCAESWELPGPDEEAVWRVASDGCDSTRMLLPAGGKRVDQDACCELHDACYQTCGADRVECDRDFERCMRRNCLAASRAEDPTSSCLDSMEVMLKGLKLPGCRHFESGQRRACRCHERDDLPDVYEAYVHAFYRKFAPEKLRTRGFLKTTLQRYAGREPELLYRLRKQYPQSIVRVEEDDDALEL